MTKNEEQIRRRLTKALREEGFKPDLDNFIRTETVHRRRRTNRVVYTLRTKDEKNRAYYDTVEKEVVLQSHSSFPFWNSYASTWGITILYKDGREEKRL